MEKKSFRRILRISYKDHVTNEEVRNKIQQAIGPYEDLTTVKTEAQIAMVRPRLTITWPRKNNLARYRARGKKR